MFESILIANRGEIACRIARTCRRLGIRTIAVYSRADAHARHVREADEAVAIGPSEAARSYLNPEAIIEAALKVGAKAVHPGYGFLSEKAVLPHLCTQHGLGWIGPRADVIEKMGSKIESKRLAERAGVPCVPGYHGEDQTPAHLLAQAGKTGWPVLIKASAGGGGKGMRRVLAAEQFLAQLELAKQEAMRAFGDERILIEKLIARPRHLEVQLAGDQHGNLVHLYERECSIQRNYQKVIEEAPAPTLSAVARERLFEAALSLGRQIGYDSLGTVEFVLDEGSDTPYFLEMNTRVQVEHPVTESITGVDLIEWQIRAACGEVLPLQQDEIKVDGWAIEARVNCEDPAHDYRPEFGRVRRYDEPAGAGIRVDSGIELGSQVSPYYDSMVAKLIGFGPSRAQACDRLLEALRGFEAAGIGTNQALLSAIVDHPRFRAGHLTTSFLAEAFENGWQPAAALHNDALIAAGLYDLLAQETARDPRDPWAAASGFRVMSHVSGAAAVRVRILAAGHDETALTLERAGDEWHARLGEMRRKVRAQWQAPDQLLLTPEHGCARRFTVIEDGDDLLVGHAGARWRLQVLPEVAALARALTQQTDGAAHVQAELPGVVTTINVAVGDTVASGDVLVVMEAMKLIFSLTAGRAGRVSTLRCAPGEVVSAGQTLVEIEAIAETIAATDALRDEYDSKKILAPR